MKTEVFQTTCNDLINPFKTFSVSIIVGSIRDTSSLNKKPKRWDKCIVSFGEWEKNPRLFSAGRNLCHKDWRTNSLGFDPVSGISTSFQMAKTLV